MVETFAKTIKDLAESAKDLKEYVPSFLRKDHIQDKGSENIFEPVVRKNKDGFTEFQKEALLQEYGLSEEDIVSYSDWDDFEAKALNNRSTDLHESENEDYSEEEKTQNDIRESTEDDAYDENGTRELTDEEKQRLKDALGWSDDKIKKCTIDKDGVIHYRTDRCDLEGKTSENGVPYERKRIVINGVTIEGVFPKFNSVFDTQLPPDRLKTNAYAKECNAALKEAVENDPELRSKFTEEQLKDIEEGRTPTGYVWHHNEEPGKMQLVKREDHDRVIGGAAHTGGNSLWGADSVEHSKEGEHF